MQEKSMRIPEMQANELRQKSCAANGIKCAKRAVLANLMSNQTFHHVECVPIIANGKYLQRRGVMKESTGAHMLMTISSFTKGKTKKSQIMDEGRKRNHLARVAFASHLEISIFVQPSNHHFLRQLLNEHFFSTKQ